MRTIHNWLLTIIGVLLFGMVMWVQERDPVLGYALGVGLIGFALFIIIERVNPRR
jgi:Flp pilus assembly protein protease CpaA